MAGEWIKVEKVTARKPEVLRIAGLLKVHADHAFGLCVRFWFWCDDHLANSNAAGVTKNDVDALLDCPGFADALLSVGWLRVRDGSLEVPNFDRHLSQSSKRRALTAARVSDHRGRKGNKKSNASGVTPSSSSSSSNSKSSSRKRGPPKTKPPKPKKFVQGEQPIPEALALSAHFIEAWKVWLSHRASIKKPYRSAESERAELANLECWGADRSVAAIKFSLSKGWQGIFEDKTQNQPLFQKQKVCEGLTDDD